MVLRNVARLLWRIFHYFLVYSALIISMVILNDIFHNVQMVWLQQPIAPHPHPPPPHHSHIRLAHDSFPDTPSPLSPDVWKSSLSPIVIRDRPSTQTNSAFFWSSFGASAEPDRRLYDLFLRPQFHLDRKYARFSQDDKEQMKRQAKEMFSHAYRSYMTHAFPEDELNPIDCRGRGPDYVNPDNVNINDVLGNFSLTLVDSLGTLAILGEQDEFKRAVRMISERVSFEQNVTLQVFETTIRVLGGLLSAHLLIEDPQQPFGDLRPIGYQGELLQLANELGERLEIAFRDGHSGIPYPRVHLQNGLPQPNCECMDKRHHCTRCSTLTCTAAVGSLWLEFGVLSRLTGRWKFDRLARRALDALWTRHSSRSGLPGNELDASSGRWTERMCGVGAGLDSYYEYLLKAYALFGDREAGDRFQTVYSSLRDNCRRGRSRCNPERWSTDQNEAGHPLYVNVHMHSGQTLNTWVDSLQAAFAGVLVLAGDVEEAICAHAVHFALWKRFDALPERFDWRTKQVTLAFYPLRPELAESTYFLYQATRNPFYLHVGRMMLESIERRARTDCGYATMHDVRTNVLEDRMESFFLSETCKYLYLLFDEDNPLNRNGERFVFSTEGHLFPTWIANIRPNNQTHAADVSLKRVHNRTNNAGKSKSDPTASSSFDSYEDSLGPPEVSSSSSSSQHHSRHRTKNVCPALDPRRHHLLPLRSELLQQLLHAFGAE